MKGILPTIVAFLSCLNYSIAYKPSQITNHVSFGIRSTNFKYCSTPSDDIFGVEFRNTPPAPASILDKLLAEKAEERQKLLVAAKQTSMTNYQTMRSNLFADSLVVSIIGFSMVWYFGTFKDSISYGVGSLLGLCYSILLGKYVERLGTSQESKASDGLRFAPVIFIVGLYAKYKTTFALIPELMGFIISYQMAGFLQIFNDDIYGEVNNDTTEKDKKEGKEDV